MQNFEFILLLLFFSICIICFTYYKIKVSCNHSWIVIDTIHIVDDSKTVIGYKYVLQCKKCGSIKFKRD